MLYEPLDENFKTQRRFFLYAVGLMKKLDKSMGW
jgi:hypothetical protein